MRIRNMELDEIKQVSKELEDILCEQGKADLTCQFCDRIHSFSGEELRRMIDELKKIGK